MPVAEYISGKIMFIYFYLLYLNTLTISLSPPTSWLHLFSIPVSEKPHLLPICSKSIIMSQLEKVA